MCTADAYLCVKEIQLMNGLPILDERLALLAGLVRGGSVVADIGSDHGYLVAWLVGRGICPHGYACDVNPMPLERSRSTARRFGVEDKITFLLSDGLEQLEENAADDIVIAGMGGDLIARILGGAGWKSGEKRYLLQPMTRADELRRWLCASGYEICAEHAACAREFCYSALTVRYTGAVCPCGDYFALLGKLPEQGTLEARAYIARQAVALQKKIEGLRASKNRSEQAAPLEELYAAVVAALGEETA